MSAPDEYKRGDDLKGKPIADEVIKNQKPLPKPPMKQPERAKPKKIK